MAYIRYDKKRRSKFFNNNSAKDRVQDISLSPFKIKVNNTYKKDEKKIEPSNYEDVVNEAYLVEKDIQNGVSNIICRKSL